MDDKQNIIGLRELLSEIQDDLDQLRKKHSGDYGIRNTAMWWELEQERLLMRHKPGCVVKTRLSARRTLSALGWLGAGWLTMLALQSVLQPWFS